MEPLLRWLAARRGIEVDPGTELRFELAGFPSGGLGFVVVLAFLAALFLVVFAYRRDAHRLTRGRRITLATLRALAVAAVFLLLLEPNLVSIARSVRPGSSIVLVDVSQSMMQRDGYRRAPDAAAAWRAAGAPSPETMPRIELAAHVLRDHDHRLLRGLAAQNAVFVYGFHSGLDPLAEVAHAQEGEATAAVELGPLAATGRYTDLGQAVRTALERHRDSAVAGLVVLSDGRRTLGAHGREIARLLEQRRVARTLVLPIGDPTATRTVRLTRIDAPDKVFRKDPFAIRANIESEGYDDIEVGVQLVQESASGERTVVGTNRVRLGTGKPEGLVEFNDLRSATAGLFTYVVEVEPPDREPPVPERHVQKALVEVLGDQTRVLVISGGPSHEFRFLRNQLIRDNTVEVSTWLLSADPDFPQDGDVVLERLPTTREELDKYDVFVFVDPNSAKLAPEFCELVAKQVDENGAGLWWVCGEIYTLDAVRKEASTHALVDLLPVVPDVERADHRFGLGRARTQPIRAELTPAGALHKVARIADDRETSVRLWSALPGVFLAFPVERAKPGAIVLAEYADAVEPQLGKSPLFATHFHGAGRVMWSGTDDTQRWRTLHEHAYERFWINGLRYLFEGRLTAGSSRLRLAVDEERLELGAPQHVVAEVATEAFTPWAGESFALVLQRENGIEEPLHLAPVEGVPGQYEARFWPAETGFFRLRPAQQIGREVVASFQVVPAEIEKEGPADLAELGAIAQAPGGELCATPAALLAAVGTVPSLTAVETTPSAHAIWDTWLTVAVVLGLLTIEWWLRKRSNLL